MERYRKPGSEVDLDTAREEFIAEHDKCLDAWDHAAHSGDIDAVAAFTHDLFRGASAYSGDTPPNTFERAEALQGLKQLVSHLRGASHRAQNRVIRLRSNEEAVVFYERVFGKDDKVAMRFLVTQVWRKTAGGWLVLREAQEVIGG